MDKRKKWFIQRLEKLSQLNLQQMAGMASIFNAFAFALGLAVIFTWFTPLTRMDISALDQLKFLINHKIWYQIWILIIYVSFGSSLVFLVLGLHQRLASDNNDMLRVGTTFGLLWAGFVIASGMIANIGLDAIEPVFYIDRQQASTLWIAVDAVHQGMGGSIEILGGMWVVMISGIAIQQKTFSKWLNYLGMMTGNVGLLTAIPELGILGGLFALLQIAWFIWMGMNLIGISMKLNIS